jgi:hypothetical protein
VSEEGKNSLAPLELDGRRLAGGGSQRVLDAALPTIEDLRYGYVKGFLTESGVVAVCLERMRLGLQQSANEESIALLLSDQHDLVGSLLGPIDVDAVSDPDDLSSARARRFWAYVFSRTIFDSWDRVNEPWQAIADIFESLELVPELSRFVYYWPAKPGQPLGLDAMLTGWLAYLDSETRYFDERTKAV